MAKKTGSISVQVAVVKKNVWEDEYLQPIATLKKTEDDVSYVRCDHLNDDSQQNRDPSQKIACHTDDQYQYSKAVPGSWGNLQAARIKKRLRYRDVYSVSEEEETHPEVLVQNIKTGKFVLVKFHPEGNKGIQNIGVLEYVQ